MSNTRVTDDHAADLSHVREVHDVVDNLRRLFVAAVQADEAGGASELIDWPLSPAGATPQSTPGR